MIDVFPQWMLSLDWLRSLVAVHYAGVVFSLIAVVVSDAVALRLLFAPGNAPAPHVIKVLHGAVVTGLCVLWLSGTAIAVTKYSIPALPAKVVFKLGAATLLSLNALLIQLYLLPLLKKPRPLAIHFTILETFQAVAIGSTSIACWSAITAVAFIAPLHVWTANELFGAFFVFWGCTACVFSALLAAAKFHGTDADEKEEPYDGRQAEFLPFPFGKRARAAATTKSGNGNGAPIYWLDQAARGSGSRAWQNGQPIQTPDSSGDSHHSFWEVAESCRQAIIGAGAVSFFANMLMLTGPLFMLQVYDRVLTSKSVPTLTALLGLAVGLFAFMGILDLIRSRLLVRIGLRLDRMLSRQVFDRVLETGDPTKRRQAEQLHLDIQQVRQFVSGAGTTALFDMPWAPAYFVLVLMFHWLLGLVALVGAAVLVALSLLNDVLSRKPIAEAAKHTAECGRLYEAGRRNSETLQSMGMARPYGDRWLREHSSELLVQTRASDTSGLLLVLSKTARLLLQSAMLAVGAYLVLQNAISAGVMIAASIIMSRALAPIEQAISHWRGFVAARQGMRRLSDEFSTPEDTDSRMAMPRPQGNITVDNIFACPPGNRDPILKGLVFSLRPGDAVGVIGQSGSGKSTLARVLVGAWPALRGHVRIDGAPLDQWPRSQLGRYVGYLPQNAELFDGTVADNISRFDVSAQPPDIYAAAEAANLHQMILSLPDGYNTMVGEGGVALSGGQRQRIALARALYGRPVLVVLDEPNSNLDAEGEAALARAVGAMRQAGQCVVVMAHRQKALEQVNLILVLKDGRQAAFGAKNDIVKRPATRPPVRKAAAHAVN